MAKKKMTKDPATAKECTSIPIRVRIRSPTERKAIIITAATRVAFPDWIWPTLLRREMMMGMLPRMSITAKRIIPAEAISLRSKFMALSFKAANLHVKTVSGPFGPMKIPRSPFWATFAKKAFGSMFQLGNTIVSEDILEKDFVCNLGACKGACCVGGEYGAPVEESETAILRDIYEKVKPFLREEGIRAIEAQGPYVKGEDGEWETPLVDNN